MHNKTISPDYPVKPDGRCCAFPAEQQVSCINEAIVGSVTFWLESSVVGTQTAAAPPTNEQHADSSLLILYDSHYNYLTFGGSPWKGIV